MSLKTSLVYSSLVFVCFCTSRAYAPKPEPPPEPPTNGPDIDVPTTTKTCEMVCRTTRRVSGRGDWKTETFWQIIRGGYTCRSQLLGKMLLDNDKYCDLFINSVDPATNNTRYYCTHAAVLSLASEKLRNEVADAIDRHVRDVTRDRDRLPSYDWPPLPQQVVRGVLDYIYTYRMTSFDAQQNIIGLYVGAFFADIKELMDLIENYLYESFNVVEQLNQLVAYLRWAHDRNYISLKETLMRIARKILKMSEEEFAQFIRDICEPNGYYRSGAIIPRGSGMLPTIGGGNPGFTSTTNIIDEIRERYNRSANIRAPYENTP